MRLTEGKAHDGRGRVGSDAATSQGVSKKARSYQKEAGKAPSLGPLEGAWLKPTP